MTVAVALLAGQAVLGGVLALVTFGGGSGPGEAARPAEVPVAAPPLRPAAPPEKGTPFTPSPESSGLPGRRLDRNAVPGTTVPPRTGPSRRPERPTSRTPTGAPTTTSAARPTGIPAGTEPAAPTGPAFVLPDPPYVPTSPAFSPPAFPPPAFTPPDQVGGQDPREPEIGQRCRREGATDRTAEGRKVRCERSFGGRLRWHPA